MRALPWTFVCCISLMAASCGGDDAGGDAEGTDTSTADTTATSSTGSPTSTTDPSGTTTPSTSTAADSSSSGADDSSSGETTGGPPEATDEQHYMGRFDFSGDGGPRSTWSGSTARTRIDGTEISIGLDGPAGIYFQTVVDGAVAGLFVTQDGPQIYPVAADLSAGQHEVEVVRRNEGYFGIVEYTGFELGEGTSFVETPWPYDLHIEFIGDSLTAGYGIECTSGDENFSAPTQSAYTSYAMVAARVLGASANLVAYSGKGVFQNYGGNTDEPMPVLFPRTLTTQPEPEWDWAGNPADVVVVNLGTNDFSADITEGDFVGAYVGLLGDVRDHYPDAAIIGITWAHWGAEHEGWVETAFTQFGDTNTSTDRFTIDPKDGYGCDFHTNVVSNQKFGDQLAATIQGLGL